MDIKEKISSYIDEHAEEMVADTMELCRINSVKGEAEPGMPFGKGPSEALAKAAEICGKYGFTVTNYDNYVITADLNDKARHLDILAHMDVVAAGEGWTVTEPYAPVVKDGRLYGRGSSDDKGPAMAALYAMRAVKELGLPLSKNCRLILGSDEECGSSDIAYYYGKEPEADMTFSPDAEFPLVNVEKGQFRAEMRRDFTDRGNGAVLLSLEGGTTTNIVPGKAFAVVRGISQADLEAACVRTTEETGVHFEIEKEEEDGFSIYETYRILADGKGAHASTPEEGKNAALATLKLVLALPLSDCQQKEALGKLLELFPYGDHYGKALGVALSDELSGNTTLSLNILKVDEHSLYAKFDSRTCVSADEKNTVEPGAEKMKEAGFSVETAFNPPHVVDADSDFVKTLLSCYEQVTGEPGKTASMGGGTYVHELKRGVAFGAVGEFTDTHMHGPDEFMVIEELKTAAKIFALSIAELCR